MQSDRKFVDIRYKYEESFRSLIQNGIGSEAIESCLIEFDQILYIINYKCLFVECMRTFKFIFR